MRDREMRRHKLVICQIEKMRESSKEEIKAYAIEKNERRKLCIFWGGESRREREKERKIIEGRKE